MVALLSNMRSCVTGKAVRVLPGRGEKVQYSVYMGGDMAETVVCTNRPELPSILIVGDSFTNPVEALCVYSFHEIRSPRRSALPPDGPDRIPGPPSR